MKLKLFNYLMLNTPNTNATQLFFFFFPIYLFIFFIFFFSSFHSWQIILFFFFAVLLPEKPAKIFCNEFCHNFSFDRVLSLNSRMSLETPAFTFATLVHSIPCRLPPSRFFSPFIAFFRNFAQPNGELKKFNVQLVICMLVKHVFLPVEVSIRFELEQ